MSVSDVIQQTNYCYSNTISNLNATIYKCNNSISKAALLYFHGGGLLYGNRNDLPEYHIEKLCNEGYAIIAFDYHLAPATKIQDILADVSTAVEWYISNRLNLLSSDCPYFLWGRSAGAYLCLLSGLKTFSEKPKGIISYYGYTFLCNHWFNTPNKYYLQFPDVDITSMTATLNKICTHGDLEDRYPLYVHSRQKGNWLSWFFEGKEKNFYAPYTFRLVSDFKNFPPTFLVHGMKDPDVPFEESRELSKLLPKSKTFFVSESVHDFDRYTESFSTEDLLSKTIDFINSLIE